MSKYSYTSVHDLKDLAMIYDDCDDYRVSVWNPETQKEMNLVFCGSSNPNKTINFIVTTIDEEKKTKKKK